MIFGGGELKGSPHDFARGRGQACEVGVSIGPHVVRGRLRGAFLHRTAAHSNRAHPASEDI